LPSVVNFVLKIMLRSTQTQKIQFYKCTNPLTSGRCGLKGGTALTRVCGCASSGFHGADPGIFHRGANERFWGTESPVGSGAKTEFSLNFQDGANRMSPRKCGGRLKTGGLCPPAAA